MKEKSAKDERNIHKIKLIISAIPSLIGVNSISILSFLGHFYQ
jgi:hypothetical protein